MFGLHDLGLFVGAVLLLNLTPGPDTAYIVARSVAQGRAAGVWSALGIATGCCVHALLAAFGLTALVAASPLAFSIVQYLGAAYLIWLGLKTIREGNGVPPATVTRSGPARAFRDGIVVEALNPKTAAFFLAFLPQFVDPSSGPV